jgi:phosphoglycolate phosphatase
LTDVPSNRHTGPAPGAAFSPRPGISHLIFDFDGTLSWLRHGWPKLMARLFLKHLPATDPSGSVDASVHDLFLDDILSLNGKSSIYQMERCAQRLLELGGPKLDPRQVLIEYLEALQLNVKQRTLEITQGQAASDDYVVHGARALLERLSRRGLTLIILSGTQEPHVKAEAQLLGIDRFFGRHIYGGTADLQQSSKKAVIDRILREESIQGEHLLSFGDGPVEIRLTIEAGGLAVGVASDEDQNGSGAVDPHKARQLAEAGADLLIPDYRNPDALLQSLLGS